MVSLTISTTDVRLSINGDPDRVITFNPKDILFAEKFYRLVGNFRAKFSEFERAVGEMDRDTRVDENGIPINADKRIALIREVCEYAREQIDALFGAGTSQTVFGDALSLEAIGEFFSGISPYVRQARTEKIKSYMPTGKPRRRK